jgi:hypothetical protein
MERPIESWLDRHPWFGRLAFMAFGVVASFFVRSGLENEAIRAGADHQIQVIRAMIPKGNTGKTETAITRSDCPDADFP